MVLTLADEPARGSAVHFADFRLSNIRFATANSAEQKEHLSCYCPSHAKRLEHVAEQAVALERGAALLSQQLGPPLQRRHHRLILGAERLEQPATNRKSRLKDWHELKCPAGLMT